jgi:hypothetical protein
MNVTIPSVMPCISIVGNGWIFVAGITVGVILAFALFLTWVRGWDF